MVIAEAQRKATEQTIDRIRSVARGIYDDDIARRLELLEQLLREDSQV